MIKLLVEALLPPFNLLLLATSAALISRWRPRSGRILLIVSLIAGYLLTTSAITGSCLRFLENRVPAATLATLTDLPAAPVAIVVLGSGSYFNAPEYGADTVSPTTLVRLRWAARLYRELQIPIFVSGGSPDGTASSEAEQMRNTLIEDFAVPVQWVETRSQDTYEAAYNTRDVLSEHGARIVLVTHAAHMPRARLVFRHVGFDVVPAATGYTTAAPATVRDFIPGAAGLISARIFLHEIIGYGWYHIRLAIGS